MQSRNVIPCVPSLAKGIVPYAEQPIEIQPDKFITGTTLDSAGDPLGSCNVYLFLTAGNVYIGQTVSDVDGSYTFYATPGALYYTVAYLAGSPDVMGTTVNTLSGEIEEPAAPPSGSTLLTGLTAYYKLEGLTEEVGGLTLTDHATVTFPAGKVNNGALFVSASSQYLSRADNAAFQFGTGTNFTVAAWLKFTTTANFTTSVCYGKVFGTALGWTLTASASGIVAGLGFNSSTNTFTSVNNTKNDGNWHLAIATFDRAGSMTVYVDNTLEATVSISANNGLTINSAVGLQIGAANGGDFFDGSVDEVGIWNRILTGAEMTELYNGGTGTTYPF